MDQLQYSILYTGSDAKTHFKDDYLPWELFPDTPTDFGHVTTPLQKATDIGFVRLSAGRRSDWHPAPRKQFIMVLTGIMELEAGDGQKRTFKPGNVLLVTDVEGEGHRTNVLGDQELMIVWVPTP